MQQQNGLPFGFFIEDVKHHVDWRREHSTIVQILSTIITDNTNC